MIWYVKRRPTGKSFFRDGFPYLECNMPEGSLWVQTQREAAPFRSLEKARSAARLARRFDKNVMIVRVKKGHKTR